MNLILASSSVRRRELLERIGYKVDHICSPDIDETPLKKEKPRILAMRLAKEKALKIAADFPNDYVVAGDTVCAVGRYILPKALEIEDAELCLSKLSGRRHRVYSGIAVAYKGKCVVKCGESIVKFKQMTNQEKKEFIESREWYGKAGGYGIQGLAARFIKWISGSESNIAGLPCYEAYCLLKGMGFKQK